MPISSFISINISFIMSFINFNNFFFFSFILGDLIDTFLQITILMLELLDHIKQFLDIVFIRNNFFMNIRQRLIFYFIFGSSFAMKLVLWIIFE